MSSAAYPALRGETDLLESLLHKMSQPLTSARGALELALLFSRSPGEYREAMQEAMREIDRMIYIKRTAMELHNVHSAELRTEAEPVLIASLLRSAADSLSSLARNRNINIEVSCPDSLRARVSSSRLGQSVSSCLQAVIRHTPDICSIMVGGQVRGRDFDILISSVEGAISPSELPRLFDPFFSPEPDAPSQGLAMARRVVEAMGGGVHAENVPGGGVRLQITLPQGMENKALVA